MPDPSEVWSEQSLAALARTVEKSFFPGMKSSPMTKSLLAPEIDGYEILGLVGIGGMGSVWRARDLMENTIVAVKLLHASWADDEGAAMRFEQEVDALARMDHPNIVRLRDAGETASGQLFFATEFVDGCDLRQLLRAGVLPVERVWRLLRQVMAAISHAHDHSIVHRDLKPANILLGEDDVVKITDFGLAKHGKESHTLATDAFGSPYYLAPELTRSAQAASPASDVYSLGVLCYEMLTGKLPLGSYTPLTKRGFRRSLDRVIERALADDPQHRTASVAQFSREIESAIRQQQRWQGGKKVALWGALAALIIGGPVAGSAWSQRHQEAPRPTFRKAETASRTEPWQNSLGMSFVPVVGSDVLFSQYEIRNREWLKFREVERSMIPSWRNESSAANINERSVMGLQGWEKRSDAELATRPDDAACGISWQDAQYFCNWLTLNERHEGRITGAQYYRLPTDDEWTLASGKNQPGDRIIGNFAGPEAKTENWPATLPTRSLADAYPQTSPCGTFPPNEHGLYDLSGNAMEWVDDVYESLARIEENEARALRTLRGGSWAIGNLAEMQSSYHFKARPNRRRVDFGFRCVLVVVEKPVTEKKE